MASDKPNQKDAGKLREQTQVDDSQMKNESLTDTAHALQRQNEKLAADLAQVKAEAQ